MLSYETIFSRARGRYYDPKELSLNRNDLLELYTERLHNVAGDARVRRLFSTLLFDDEIQQLTYTLNYSVDDEADEAFVIDVFVLGMIIEWLRPQVDSVMNTSVYIGGKEEKSILNNHSNMIGRLDALRREQYKLIRDHGYLYNSYVDG